MTEAKWGEAAKREDADKRARLLAAVPAEHREALERLMASCEGERSLQNWSFLLAYATIAQAMRSDAPEEVRRDVLRGALQFYRLACMADTSRFWLEQARDSEGLGELLQGLAYGAQDGFEQMRRAAERLRLLSEALETVTEK